MINSKNITLLLFSKICERIAFYIINFSLVYFLVDYFNYPQSEVDNIYVNWKNGIFASMILGGVVGDFWLGDRKAARLGVILILIGLILCFYAPLIYAAMSCLVLGLGIYGSNMLVMFSRSYMYSLISIDKGLMIYYIVVNIGSFIGVTFNGFVMDMGFHTIVIASLVFALISAITLFLVPPTQEQPKEVAIAKNFNGVNMVFGLVALLVALFWMLHLYADNNLEINAQQIFEGNTIWIFFGTILLLFIAAIYLLVRQYTTFSISKRLWLGYAIIGILFLLMYFQVLTKTSFFGMKIMSYTAEIMMINILFILIVKNVPSKYWGVAISIVMASALFSGWEKYLFTVLEKNPYSSLVVVVLSIVACIMVYIYKKPMDELGHFDDHTSKIWEE